MNSTSNYYTRGNSKLDPAIKKAYDTFVSQGIKPKNADITRMMLKSKAYTGSKSHLEKIVRAWLINNLPENIEIVQDQSQDQEQELDMAQMELLPPDKNPGATSFEVDNGIYKIKARKGTFERPVSEMDEIFMDYSVHGRDHDMLTVVHKHNLEFWQFYAIRQALNLYKQGHIFSPATCDSMSPTDFKNHMAVKMEMLYNDKLATVKDEFSKAKGSMYKKAIEERNKGVYRLTSTVDHLLDCLPKVTPLTPTYTGFSILDASVIDDLVVTVADLHIGANVNDACLKSQFNRDIAKQRLATIADNVNNMKSKHVHIAFLGDMMESFMAMMHKETYKETEQGMWGAALVEACVDILHDFISKVKNVSGVYFVGGNHDRVTNEWNGDTRAEAGQLVFTFLKREFELLKRDVKLEWQNLAVKADIGPMRYIFAHGDKRGNYKDKKNYFLDFGDTTKYNVLMTGHLHSRETGLDNHNRRWIQCPSLFSGNWHSKSMGYEAPPGFIMTYANRDGKLMVIDTTL